MTTIYNSMTLLNYYDFHDFVLHTYIKIEFTYLYVASELKKLFKNNNFYSFNSDSEKVPVTFQMLTCSLI